MRLYYFNRQDDDCGTTSRHQRELFYSPLNGEPVSLVEIEAAVADDGAE